MRQFVYIRASASYLEVTVHHPVLVQEADGLQHLLDHPAGVLLRVHAPVQDAVEELAARDAGGRRRGGTNITF